MMELVIDLKAPEIKINNLEKYKKLLDILTKRKISGFMNNNLEKLLEAEKKIWDSKRNNLFYSGD